MKKIILTVVFSTLSLYPQNIGVTRSGSLFPTEDKIGPEIIVLEPAFNHDTIIVNSRVQNLRLNIRDESLINSVIVNETQSYQINDSTYGCRINLSEGINQIKIIAIDEFNNVSNSQFIIKNLVDISPPEINIIEPEVRGIDIVHKKDVLTVKGIANDISGISEIFINDKMVDVITSDGHFMSNIVLEVGSNLLVIKAIDKRLNEGVDSFRVIRKLEDVIKNGKYIGLVIGINSYEGYFRPLRNAINDAKEFGKLLKYDYNFDTIIYILDKHATRKSILRKLQDLTDTNFVRRNDNLLIYYAGHGQKKLKEGYWVPVDAQSNSIDEFIPNVQVKNLIANINSKHILLITDACFAGDIFTRGTKDEEYPFDINNVEKYYKEAYRKKSRIALTSGGDEPVADSGIEGHSIFAYYLIESLKKNQNPLWTVEQLFTDFQRAVINNSDQSPICNSLKETNDEGGKFIFMKRFKK